MTDDRTGGNRFLRVNQRHLALCLCGVILGLWLNPARALPLYTLCDGNASARVDVDSQAGLSDWTVDGRDVIDQEWFWYRIGNCGPETSLDNLGCPRVVQPSASAIQATYANRQLSIQVLYSLAGGVSGSGTAQIEEQIVIRNRTCHTLDFHFYEYADLDFSGTTRLATDPEGFNNEPVAVGDGSVLSETTATDPGRGADHGVAGIDTLAQLNDRFATRLGDDPGPSTNATWTLEWDRRIGAKETLILARILCLAPVPVPEPPAWSMVTLGLVAFLGFYRLLKRR